MKAILLILMATISFGVSTWAAGMSSLLLEPSVGYRTETFKFTDQLRQETQYKSSHPVYGLKLGYHSLIGVDMNLAGEFSNGQMEVTGQSEKSKFSHQTASVQLGVNALGALKIYLGYAFLNEFKTEDTLTLAGFKMTGPAYLAGLQFKLLPFINLGLQYNLNTFKKVTGRNFPLGEETDTYFSKIDTQDYAIYLSVSF